MQYEFIGYSVPGGVAFYGSEQARHARTVAQFKGGVPIKVIYKKVNKSRTIPQNSRYWARNQELAEFTGYSRENLHEEFMRKCGFGKQVLAHTTNYFFRISSTELDIKQFSELMTCQDELVNFLNEGVEPENQIRLSERGE